MTGRRRGGAIGSGCAHGQTNQVSKVCKQQSPAAVSKTNTPNKAKAPCKAGEVAFMPISEEEVVAAIHSLYDDQLRPYGRIIRKRLAERRQIAPNRSQPNKSAGLEPKAEELRELCGGSRCLTLEREDGGEWSALLVGRRENFVDIYSEVDPYSSEMWEAAAAYFSGLSGEGGANPSGKLPGGRYASARELLARRPGFLDGCTFGQVCHIMELALSKKSLLGYLDGAVVPYKMSVSKEKQRCAVEQRPCRGADAASKVASGPCQEEYRVVDWPEARQRLRDILAEGPVPLSNVKRLFRSQFHLELSETALGHAKISQLLKDDRFSDICIVNLQDRGYIVSPALPGIEAQLTSLTATAAAAAPPGIEAPLLESRDRSMAQTAAPAELCLGSAFRQRRGRRPPALDPDPEPPFSTPVSVSTRPDSTPSYCSDWWTPASAHFISPQAVGGVVKNTFIDTQMPPVTPTGPSARFRAASLPKDHGSGKDSLEAAYIALQPVDTPSSTRAEKGTPTSQLSSQTSPSSGRRRPPTPLALEEDDLPDDSLQELSRSPTDRQAYPVPGRTPLFSRRTPMSLDDDVLEGLDPIGEDVKFLDSGELRLVDFEPAYIPKTPVCMGDFYPQRTPSPQWGTSKLLFGRSPRSSPKNSQLLSLAQIAAPQPAADSSPSSQLLSLATLLPNGTQPASFSPCASPPNGTQPASFSAWPS